MKPDSNSRLDKRIVRDFSTRTTDLIVDLLNVTRYEAMTIAAGGLHHAQGLLNELRAQARTTEGLTAAQAAHYSRLIEGRPGAEQLDGIEPDGYPFEGGDLTFRIIDTQENNSDGSTDTI